MFAAAHLKLVFDPRPGGQDGRRRPEVGAGDPAHRQRLRKPDNAVPHPHVIGLAAKEERRALLLDDRRAVAFDETVDALRVQGRPLTKAVRHSGVLISGCAWST